MSITEELQEAIAATRRAYSKLRNARSHLPQSRGAHDRAEIEQRIAYSHLIRMLDEEIRLPLGE